MLRFNVTDAPSAHAGLVASHVLKSFPQPQLGRLEAQSVADAVMFALVANGKIRFVAPNIENYKSLRFVVEKLVEAGEPIRMLMPWGSKKPDNGTVDVAEIGGLKTISALADRVRAAYAPGVKLVVRVEDTSGDYLFREDGEAALWASTRYVSDFSRLFRASELDFAELVFESEMLDVDEYVVRADRLRHLFAAFIADLEDFGIVDDPSLGSWRALEDEGWKGFVPTEMRDFYRSRYARSGADLRAQNWKLAGYLASILARVQMRGYGSEQWGRDFVNVSFAPPVPGTPRDFAERRLYYRTVPETETRTHIPPWRARGYLKIEGPKVSTKLASFEEKLDLVPATLVVEGGGERVEVRAPRMVV